MWMPTTPPRSSRSGTRYPDLGRVPLHRRGTSKTYERLEDLLKEAGYKETRVFTPEGERAEAKSATQSSDRQGGVRTSVGAFVGFLAGLMPAASRSTSSLTSNVEAYSPPASPLTQRELRRPVLQRANTSSSDLASSLESLDPTPRPSRFIPPSRTSTPLPASAMYSQPHSSQQDLRPTHFMVHRDQYSNASSRRPPLPLPPTQHSNSPLPTAGPSYQHIAQPRPSRAGAYLRHMASAPNMPKRPASAAQRRRTLLTDDSDADAMRAENGKPPLPESWIESVARAVLFGGVGAYIGGPPIIEPPTQAQAFAARHKTLRHTRSSLSQVSTKQQEVRLVRSGLSDKTNTSKGKSEMLLGPPELFTRIERGRAGTSAGEVSRTRVVCRSAPASRSVSAVRGGSEESRRKKDKDRREGGESKNGKGHGRGRAVERRLPSLANTQTEGDKWVKNGKRGKEKDRDAGRNRYLSGWGMDGEPSDDDEEGLSSSSDEDGELNLARMLVNPKRQNSIVSLRRHLNDEIGAGKPRQSTGMRPGRGLNLGAVQGSRSGSVRQRIVEGQDWDGSEAEDWGQGWIRKNARKPNSEDDVEDDGFARFLGEDRSGKVGRFGSGRSGAEGSRLGIPGKWAITGGGS
ncbi:hypothetical protein C0991_004986 [Blastosporella zonata]|nr:hypothetical protein C0991_004986 [Blastosporella zonata]